MKNPYGAGNRMLRRLKTQVAYTATRSRTAILLLATGICLAASSAKGQEDVHFQVVGERFCARGTLTRNGATIPGNIVIDLGSPVPLLVHETTARLLGVGHGTPVDLTLDKVNLRHVEATAATLTSLEDLTREYASELGELPAVAILGLPAVADFQSQLDRPADTLHLTPIADAHSPGEGDGDNTAAIAFEDDGRGYWLSAVGPDDYQMRVRFGTGQPYTLIDETTAALCGAPGGDLAAMHMGSIDVSRFVALRPEDLSAAPEPRPDVILGTDFFTSWRVTINVPARRMIFEPTGVPVSRDNERAFYVARADDDPDAIEALLPARLPAALAAEAAETLLAARLDAYPIDREAYRRAAQLVAETTRRERCAERMVALADELMAGDKENRDALAGDALDIAQKYAAADLNARARYDILARQGQVALAKGDLKEARRHLLSAAFGLPREPMIQLALGQLYERMGKKSRAWSRFVEAAIGDEPPLDAFRGLDRLNRDPDFRRTFTMTDARQLLEGRVPEYHPLDRWTDDGAPGRMQGHLVELFSCIDAPATQAAELAFGALDEYFESAGVVMVAYHLSLDQVDPLESEISRPRAAVYGVTAAPMAFFDGGHAQAQGGDEAAAPAVFGEYRTTATALAGAAKDWKLTGAIRRTGDQARGEIVVDGPAAVGHVRLVVLLCEKLVMAPGANGLVLHRNVVRAAVSPPEGLRLTADAGQRRLPIEVRGADVSARLAEQLANTEKEKSIAFVMTPTYVDMNMCAVVAFVQDMGTRQVYAARVFEIPSQGATRP